MKRFERIAAGVFFVIGSGAAYLAIEMGYGSARFPGPGFLPFWIAILLVLTAGLYFLARLGSDTARRRLWERRDLVERHGRHDSPKPRRRARPASRPA